MIPGRVTVKITASLAENQGRRQIPLSISVIFIYNLSTSYRKQGAAII